VTNISLGIYANFVVAAAVAKVPFSPKKLQLCWWHTVRVMQA